MKLLCEVVSSLSLALRTQRPEGQAGRAWSRWKFKGAAYP